MKQRHWNLLSAILPFLMVGLSFAQSHTPKVIVVLHSSQTIPAAFAKFQSLVGKGACDCSILGESDLTPATLAHANALFLQHPSQELLSRLKPAALSAMKDGMQVATDVTLTSGISRPPAASNKQRAPRYGR